MTKHTEIPWKVTADRMGMVQDIFSGDTFIGYVSETNGRGEDEAKANANFIVKAVNNYEALMSLCKEAKELRDDILTKDDLNRHWNLIMKLLADCEQTLLNCEDE